MLLALGTTAVMTAWKKFITWFLHEVEAISFSTNVFEGRNHTWRWLLHFVTTESASFCKVLITSLSNVVWFWVALRAEVLLAAVASDSEICHVFGCFHGYWLTHVIFLTFDYVSWHKFHDISALTTDKVIIEFTNLHCLSFFDLF